MFKQRLTSTDSRTTDSRTTDAAGAHYLGKIPPDSELSYLTLSGYRSKPIFDMAVATFAAIVLLPMALIIAVAVKLTSRGPVLTSEERIGKRGERFQQIAFRTTSQGRPSTQYPASLLTPIGHLLDHTGLHKLPQLLNVGKGEMSMVGPKALRPAETHFYGSALPIILSVKPGILEPRPVPKDERNYEDGTLIQSELDVAYVADRSFTLDLRICGDALHQKTAGRG